MAQARPTKKVSISNATPVAPATPVRQAAPVVVVQQQQTQGRADGVGPRPLGVTIVSVLTLLGMAGWVIAGIFWIVAAAAGATVLNMFWGGAPSWLISLISIFGAIAAIISFGVATLFYFVGVGNLRGRAWAWTTVLLISMLWGLFMVLGLFGASPDGMIWLFVELGLAALIIWYYYTPTVKRFFGKQQMRALWQRHSVQG